MTATALRPNTADTLPKPQPLKLFATGFVSADGGSVAGANAVFLRELLTCKQDVSFFSKPSFVDPRVALADRVPCKNFVFVDTTNFWPDRLRRRLAFSRFDPFSYCLHQLDHQTYVRKIVKAMRGEHARNPADLTLWLGTWATGRIAGVPTVSFVQGAPGTDAGSLEKHRDTIIRLAGAWHFRKLSAYARWRMSFGLPAFKYSDHVIVGSKWSRQRLIDRFGLSGHAVHTCPYPIDLNMFQPGEPRPTAGRLRVLWLGRFVPRKRLDLFLNGLALAIREGVDTEAVVVGKSGFVPNYEQLIHEFPFPDRVRWIPGCARNEVPTLMHSSDVLGQPSDDEDFGSSVAEAQACGLPVIVGATNGTGDYICSRSIRLLDDRPETFASVLSDMMTAKRSGLLSDPSPSRSVASATFGPDIVTAKLVETLQLALSGEVTKSANG